MTESAEEEIHEEKKRGETAVARLGEKAAVGLCRLHRLPAIRPKPLVTVISVMTDATYHGDRGRK